MGEIPVLMVTRVAAQDLTNHQYGAVTLNGAGEIVKAGAGVEMFGILQHPARLGEAASVMVIGVSYAKLAGPVTPGAKLATDAAGLFVVNAGAAAQSGAAAIDTGATNGLVGVLLR